MTLQLTHAEPTSDPGLIIFNKIESNHHNDNLEEYKKLISSSIKICEDLKILNMIYERIINDNAQLIFYTEFENQLKTLYDAMLHDPAKKQKWLEGNTKDNLDFITLSTKLATHLKPNSRALASIKNLIADDNFNIITSIGSRNLLIALPSLLQNKLLDTQDLNNIINPTKIEINGEIAEEALTTYLNNIKDTMLKDNGIRYYLDNLEKIQNELLNSNFKVLMDVFFAGKYEAFVNGLIEFENINTHLLQRHLFSTEGTEKLRIAVYSAIDILFDTFKARAQTPYQILSFIKKLKNIKLLNFYEWIDFAQIEDEHILNEQGKRKMEQISNALADYIETHFNDILPIFAYLETYKEEDIHYNFSKRLISLLNAKTGKRFTLEQSAYLGLYLLKETYHYNTENPRYPKAITLDVIIMMIQNIQKIKNYASNDITNFKQLKTEIIEIIKCRDAYADEKTYHMLTELFLNLKHFSENQLSNQSHSIEQFNESNIQLIENLRTFTVLQQRQIMAAMRNLGIFSNEDFYYLNFLIKTPIPSSSLSAISSSSSTLESVETDDKKITAEEFRRHFEAAWEDVSNKLLKAHRASRNNQYDSQVIVQLEDNEIVRNAVEALAAKHGSELPTIIVQLRATGEYTIISGNDTPQAERAKLTGRMRWQIVGHGRDSSSDVANRSATATNMSGRTAEQLAIDIRRLRTNLSLPLAAHEPSSPSTSQATNSSTPLNKATIAHISLVGCQLIDEAGKTGFAVDFINKLPRQLTNDGKLTVSAHAVDIAVSDTAEDIGRKFELVTQVEGLPDNHGSELKKQKFILSLNQDNELQSTASSDIAKRTPYQQTLSKLGEIDNIIIEIRAGERSVYDLNMAEKAILKQAFPDNSADGFDKNRIVSLAFNARQYEKFSQQIAVVETYGAESDLVVNKPLNEILSITEAHINQQQHIMEEIVRFDIENSSAASPNRSITLLPSPTLALFGNDSPAERQRTLGLGLSWLQNRLSSGESTHFISAVRHHTLFSDARAQGAMLVTQDVEYYHQFAEQLNNMGALAETHATTWFKPITLMNGSWALADGAYQFNIDGNQAFLHIDAAHHKYALYQAGAAVIESTGTADDGGKTATDFYRTVDTLLQRQRGESLQLYQLQTDKLAEIAQTPTARALNSAVTNLATKTEWQKIATHAVGDNPTGKFLINTVQIEALRLVQLGATFAGRPLTLADFNDLRLTGKLRFDGEKVANFIYSADVQDPEVQNIRKLLLSAKKAQFTGPQGEHIFKSLKASIKDSSLLTTQVPAHFNTPHFTLSQRALNHTSNIVTKYGYLSGFHSLLMGRSQLQQLQQQDTSQMSPTQLAQYQQAIADAKRQLSMGFGQMAFNGGIDAAQFAITRTWGINLLNKMGPRAFGRAAVAIPGLNLLSLAFDGYQIIDTHQQLQKLQLQLASTTDPTERNRLEWEIGRTKVNQGLNYASLGVGIAGSGVLLVSGLASAGIISSTGTLAGVAASGPIGWMVLGGIVVIIVATQAFTAASRVAELNQQIWLTTGEKWENFFSYIAYGEATDREINRLSWHTFVTKGRPEQEQLAFKHAKDKLEKNNENAKNIGYITSTTRKYEALPIYEGYIKDASYTDGILKRFSYQEINAKREEARFRGTSNPIPDAKVRRANRQQLLDIGFTEAEITKTALLYYRCIETKESTNDSIDLNNSQTFTKSFNGTAEDNSKHTYGIFTPTEHKSVLVELGDGNDSFIGLKNHPEITEIVRSGSGIKDFKGGDGSTLFNVTQLTAGSVYDGGKGFNTLTSMPPTTSTYDIIIQAEERDEPTTSGSHIIFHNINKIVIQNTPDEQDAPTLKIEDRAHQQNYIDVGNNPAIIKAGGGNDTIIFCSALVSGGEGEDIYAVYKNQLLGSDNIARIDIEDDDYPHQCSYLFLEYDAFDIKHIEYEMIDYQPLIIFLLKDNKGAETSLRIKSKNFILQTRDGVQITYRPEQLKLLPPQQSIDSTVVIKPKLLLSITSPLAAGQQFLPAVFHQNPNPVSHKVMLTQQNKSNVLTRHLTPSSPAETWQIPSHNIALSWSDENAWLKNERYSDNLMQSSDEIEAPTLADEQIFTLVSSSGNDVLKGNGGKLNYIVNVNPGQLNRTITINNRDTIGTLIFGSVIGKLSHIIIEGKDVILQTQDKPEENTRIRLIDFANNPAMQDLIIIAKKRVNDPFPSSRYIIKFDHEGSMKKPRLVELVEVEAFLTNRDKREKRLQSAGDITRQLNNDTMLIDDTTSLPAGTRVTVSGDKKTVYDSSTTPINYILTAAAATLNITVPDSKDADVYKNVTIQGPGTYNISNNFHYTDYRIDTKKKSHIVINSFAQRPSIDFIGFDTPDEATASFLSIDNITHSGFIKKADGISVNQTNNKLSFTLKVRKSKDALDYSNLVTINIHNLPYQYQATTKPLEFHYPVKLANGQRHKKYKIKISLNTDGTAQTEITNVFFEYSVRNSSGTRRYVEREAQQDSIAQERARLEDESEFAQNLLKENIADFAEGEQFAPASSESATIPKLLVSMPSVMDTHLPVLNT